MNLLIERGPAATALARAVGIVEKKQVIPILGHVALTADGEQLSLRVCDTEMESIETIAAQVREPGQITIPADKLHSIVGSSDAGAQIAISHSAEDPRVKVKFGRSNFSVPTILERDIPTLQADTLGDSFVMPAKTLARMLTRVRWMAEGSFDGDAKSCVFVEVKGGQLIAVACNSFGVVKCMEPAPEGAVLAGLLPMKLVRQLEGWLSGVEGDAIIETASWAPGDRGPEWVLQRKIRVRHGGRELTSILFDAPNYVDYGRVIIDEHELTAITDRDALATAIRRVLIMRDSRDEALRLDFSAGGICVKARNAESGEGVEEIAAEYDGPDATVLMKPRLIQETLGALTGDRVFLSFAPAPRDRDAHSVKVVIKAPVDPSFLATLAQPRA